MDRILQKMHHGSEEHFPLKTFVTAAILIALVGCGGGEQESAPTAPATTAAAPSAPATEGNTKPLTEGMMLPDDVPLSTEPEQSNGAAGGIDGGKGMQLPDDLQPSAMSAPRQIHAVQLVNTEAETPSTDIRYGDWEKIQAEIAKTGTVTVVDFWSLACIPCLREYPQLVSLQKQYPGRVRAIGVNLDFDGRKNYPAESYEDRAESFLSAVGATFPNYLSQTQSEDVFKSVEIASLPAVLVYDAKGNLAARFTDSVSGGSFNYENDVMPLVQKLLSEPNE